MTRIGQMKGMPETQKRQVVDFILERDTGMLSWPDGALLDLVEFYAERGAIGLVWDGPDLVGVGIARPCCVDGVKSSTAWDFNEFGDCMYVHSICADDPHAVAVLWQLMVERFGRREWFSGRRHGEIRIWPFMAYEKKVKILQKK